MKKIALFATSVLITLCATSQRNALDSLRRVAAENPADSSTISSYLLLSNHYINLNTDSALLYAQKAYNTSSKLKYAYGIAEGKALQAKIYLGKGEYAKAYEHYLGALHKFTMLNYAQGIAGVYNGLGTTFLKQENYARALQY